MRSGMSSGCPSRPASKRAVASLEQRLAETRAQLADAQEAIREIACDLYVRSDPAAWMRRPAVCAALRGAEQDSTCGACCGTGMPQSGPPDRGRCSWCGGSGREQVDGEEEA